ncbi:MAG: hypothetical protein V1702_00490 [Candidatus Woesearchaeota archaeon]
MKTVTIPLSEYKKLKKKAEVDEELLAKCRASFEACKKCKVKEWAPK